MQIPLPDIFFNSIKLNWIDNFKYLDFNNKLTFNPQINRIEGQFSRDLSVIYRNNNFSSRFFLLKLYN